MRNHNSRWMSSLAWCMLAICGPGLPEYNDTDGLALLSGVSIVPSLHCTIVSIQHYPVSSEHIFSISPAFHGQRDFSDRQIDLCRKVYRGWTLMASEVSSRLKTRSRFECQFLAPKFDWDTGGRMVSDRHQISRQIWSVCRLLSRSQSWILTRRMFAFSCLSIYH